MSRDRRSRVSPRRAICRRWRNHGREFGAPVHRAQSLRGGAVVWDVCQRGIDSFFDGSDRIPAADLFFYPSRDTFSRDTSATAAGGNQRCRGAWPTKQGQQRHDAGGGNSHRKHRTSCTARRAGPGADNRPTVMMKIKRREPLSPVHVPSGRVDRRNHGGSQCIHARYAARSATAGSVSAARHAGTRHAASATAINPAGATVKATAQRKYTPILQEKFPADRCRMAQRAAGSCDSCSIRPGPYARRSRARAGGTAATSRLLSTLRQE